MRYFLIPISILAAFFLEWTVGQKISLWFVPPPFLTLVLLYWFWNIKFAARVWLGIIAGILLDGISAFPFGTHMVVFVALGAGTEFFRFFFSNVESALTRSISIGALIFMFLAATPALGYILDFQREYIVQTSFASASNSIPWSFILNFIRAAVLWAVACALFFLIATARYAKR